ncbi:MAG: RAD55 family ATPase [Candidatus Heimdallarchaeota archaeon]
MIPKRTIGSEGLDELLGGGIPEDRCLLVVGGPGTGKTTIGVQFLLEGAVIGENGLHILTEESPAAINARFDFLHQRGKVDATYNNALKTGKITIIDLLSARIGYREKYNLPNIICPPIVRLGDILGIIYDAVRDNDIKRVVIDSFQSFITIAEREVVQLREVLLAIIEPYRRVRVGLLVTSERHTTSHLVPISIEHDSYLFLVHVFDGVISLAKGLAQNQSIRSLKVEKAIWTKHDLRPYRFRISESGIEVLDPL